MPYDSMAAWDRQNFQFNDDIQQRGASWSGQFSFEYGAGTSIVREDYVPPSPPASPNEAPRFTDAVLTWSPPPSPRASPPPSPRVDSAKSFASSPPNSPVMDRKRETKLANQLFAAACTGDLDNIRHLLNVGAPINIPTIVRDLYDAFKPPKPGTLSALAGAAGHGQLDAVELLISEGAAINPSMKQSSSAPLHQACRADDVEIARALLEMGADINALNCYKTTPLMYAVKYGSPDLVELILSYGPDMHVTSFINTAAIHWAIWPNHEHTTELLLEAGANPNHAMGDGSTPLHCAAGSGFVGIVELLLRHGADPKVRNNDWNTPRTVAEAEGQEEIVQLLREAERRATVMSA